MAAVVVASGCISSTNTSQGEFELLVSDQPADIDSFDYLKASFSKARIYRHNSSQGSQFQEISLNQKTSDLTQLKGSKAESLLNTTLSTGNYTKIELYVESVNASRNGTNADVKVPPGKLMITKPFEVNTNQTTSFVFDIQVTQRGGQGGYILRPVISESGVAGEDVEMERTHSRDRMPESPDNQSQQQNQPENPGNSSQR